MLKAPVPGRVKTRLAADIGTGPACWWFRHQVRGLLRRLADPRWRLVLALSPDRALHAHHWPAQLPRVGQGGGDLGTRMARIFQTLPPGPACIIGGDIPGLRPAHVADAFARLGRHEAVFGPTPDGGYWLIGLHRTRALPAGALAGVRWSSPHALADTRASLKGLRMDTVATLCDVDTGADLAAISR